MWLLVCAPGGALSPVGAPALDLGCLVLALVLVHTCRHWSKVELGVARKSLNPPSSSPQRQLFTFTRACHLLESHKYFPQSDKACALELEWNPVIGPHTQAVLGQEHRAGSHPLS